MTNKKARKSTTAITVERSTAVGRDQQPTEPKDRKPLAEEANRKRETTRKRTESDNDGVSGQDQLVDQCEEVIQSTRQPRKIDKKQNSGHATVPLQEQTKQSEGSKLTAENSNRSSKKRRRGNKIVMAVRVTQEEQERIEHGAKSGGVQISAEVAATSKVSSNESSWTCDVCGTTGFRTSQAFSSHKRCCSTDRTTAGTVVPKSGISLLPDCLKLSSSKLSDLSHLLVSGSIELFEATDADLEVQNGGSGNRNIEVGNIGIRCVHCSNGGVMRTGSVSYPNNLQTLPHNVYNMVHRHLLNSCQAITSDIRYRIVRAKLESTSQSVRRGGLGLPAYLKMVYAYYDLTDGGLKEGIYVLAHPSQIATPGYCRH